MDAGHGHLDAIVDALVRAGNEVRTGWTRDEHTWSLRMRDPIDFGALGRLARRRPYRAVVFDDARDLVSCAHCWSQILGGNVRTDPPEPWDPSTESWVEYRARG